MVIPALAVIASAVVKDAAGPCWFGDRNDPDYAYLLNSVNIAEGRAPRHTDHPGTTVQELGAGVLLAQGVLSGGPASVTDRVLDNPESALSAIRVVLVAMVFGALTWFGLAALRFTGSVWCGLAAQALPLASFTVLVSLHRVTPEPLLLAISLALGAVMLGGLSRDGAVGTRYGVGSAVVSALGLATKVTFVPVLLVPVGLLWRGGGRGWRLRGLFVLTFAVSLVLALTPVLGQWKRVLGWMLYLSKTSGSYVEGFHPVAFDVGSYARTLLALASAEPVSVVCAVSGLAVAAWCLGRRGWKGLDARARSLVVSLVAVSVAEVLQFLMVARHPEPRYLIPGIGLCGVSFCLMSALVRANGPKWSGRTGAGVAAVAVVIAVLWTAQQLQTGLHMIRADTSGRRVVAAAADAAIKNGGIVISTYGASSPAGALYLGNDWAGNGYTEAIARRHPGEAQLDIWQRLFRRGNVLVQLDDVMAWARQGRLYFQGAPHMRPAGFQYRALTPEDAAAPEVLYKVSTSGGP